MPKTHELKIRRLIAEDQTGRVYQAQDTTGQRVYLRKFKVEAEDGEELHGGVEVAYQVALERLTGIRHPSLRQVISGGVDPDDKELYIATKSVEGEILLENPEAPPLSVDTCTQLLFQLLEVSELLSHLLAEDGVWVETTPKTILVSEGEGNGTPRFVFWPAPHKAMLSNSKSGDYECLAELAERVLRGHDREAGHLELWVKWLREEAAKSGARIREVREMLAATAGVEPPPAIEHLVASCRHKESASEKLARIRAVLKLPAPKMPLLCLLAVMLVVQAVVGWLIVRGINDNIDDQLEELSSDYWSSPYTIELDPKRKDERGSQPLNF